MSSLRLRYGSYTHPDSEAAVTIQRGTERNDSGLIYGIRETWSIRGRLQADTQSELTTLIDSLEAAYSRPASEIALEFSDTGTDTAHSMTVANLLGPIQVLQPPSYPIGDGAQYAGFRDYEIVVQGLIKTGSANAELLQWEETIEISGGYPRDVLVQTLNTPPIRQRAANYTPAVVRQFGMASSLRGWPIPPAYRFNVFSQAVLFENSVQKRGAKPQLINGIRRGTIYTSTWSYGFLLPFLTNVPGSHRPLSMATTLY